MDKGMQYIADCVATNQPAFCPTRSDAGWYQYALRKCTAVCFPRSRQPYKSSPVAYTIFYFGSDPAHFRAEYEFIGECK